jgi:hypothetical protein
MERLDGRTGSRFYRLLFDIHVGGDSIMKVVFLNVTPDGELYGFPKQVPNELIIWYGGDDYDLKPEWRKWASEVGGYPKIDGKNVRFGHYMRDVDVG